MEFAWDAESYRDIINSCLGYRQSRRPRGAIKKLADHLRCHPTFISQVLNTRAHLSLEQAFDLSDHFGFSDRERDFFIHMLIRDRAGKTSLRVFFQKKIDQLLEEKRDLRPQQQNLELLPSNYEAEYFGNWVYQVIHALTQLPAAHTPAQISKAIGLNAQDVTIILQRLENMRLVKKGKSGWQSTIDSLHLPKDSHLIRSLHTSWKVKILSDIQHNPKIDGTRYSGVITVSEKDSNTVRDILVEALSRIRKIVANSKAENAYTLSIDFYKL